MCGPRHALVHDGQRMNKTTTEYKFLWWWWGGAKKRFFLYTLFVVRGNSCQTGNSHTHTHTHTQAPLCLPLHPFLSIHPPVEKQSRQHSGCILNSPCKGPKTSCSACLAVYLIKSLLRAIWMNYFNAHARTD